MQLLLEILHPNYFKNNLIMFIHFRKHLYIILNQLAENFISSENDDYVSQVWDEHKEQKRKRSLNSPSPDSPFLFSHSQPVFP